MNLAARLDVWEELTIARNILSLLETLHTARNSNSYLNLAPILDSADLRIESIMLSLETLQNRNSYRFWRRKLQNSLHCYLRFLANTIDNSLLG